MQRYTDHELEALLNDTESDLAERKKSFKGDTPKKGRQAVCAFANDLPNHNKPGVLFIGAWDDGNPSNEPITDQLLRGLNEQEERILIEKRRYKNLPFDIYPVPSAKITDLSKTIFENEYLPSAFAADILEENNRSYEERLASCKMVVSPDDTTPTVLGLLSVGKTPQDFIPGACIQFLRIDGTELADPVIDEESIGGGFVEMLRRSEEKLRAHNRTAVDITMAATHQVDMPFPPAALQQILYNAVLHRTYESTNAPVRVYWFNDRIEINSPGGPYGNVTGENFGRPGITDYRNPNIGDVLKTFGFIQAFGRGIAVARRETAKNGNPDLEFETSRSAVVCILRGKP
ncbi:ATP-binding protein [Desulfobacter sp.]|uniref:ATP-binding protein n=1 Tax=Desulfobacter sp. TaxID=2294 RepID=UPI003D139483